MSAAEAAVTAVESLQTANDRLKQSFSAWFWGSMIAAAVIHFGVFAFWPELTAEDVSFTSEELETIELPPEIEIPPPPEEKQQDLAAAPTFTPFTVAPSILNRDDVIRAMEREYPPLLRDAGIGGTVRVYFFIDENGQVQDTRIDQSSGHQALDDAALKVAGIYRFSPALNRDKKVPVWVSFPISFQVR